MFPYSLHIAFADNKGSVDLFDITFDSTASRRDVYYIIDEIRKRILCPFEKSRKISPYLFSFLSFLTMQAFKSYTVAINPMFKISISNISNISNISISSISELDTSFQDWFPREVKMIVSVRKEGERIVSVPIFGEKSEGFTDNECIEGNNGENGGNEGNDGNTDENDNNEAYNDDRIRYITKLLFY